MPSRCCEFVDSRLRRSPPDRASAVPMDKPGKTRCVSPTLPTGRRLLHKLHSTPQQHGMILISGNGEITSRLYAFSLFFPGSCPNNRDRRSSELGEIAVLDHLFDIVRNVRAQITAAEGELTDAHLRFADIKQHQSLEMIDVVNAKPFQLELYYGEAARSGNLLQRMRFHRLYVVADGRCLPFLFR